MLTQASYTWDFEGQGIKMIISTKKKEVHLLLPIDTTIRELEQAFKDNI